MDRYCALLAASVANFLLFRQNKNFLASRLSLPVAFLLTFNSSSVLPMFCWPIASSVSSYWYSKFTRRHSVTKKKLVVITGCDTGLGYSLAKHCHRLGLSVASGCLDTESDGAKDLNGIALVLHLDVTKKETVVAFLEEVDRLLRTNNYGEYQFQVLMIPR